MAIGTMDEFNSKKKDLENQIAEAEKEAEFIPGTEKLDGLKQDLERLEKSKASYEDKVEQAEVTPENQVKQVESLGGNETVLAEKTAEVDQKIEGVKEETAEKVAVKGEPKGKEAFAKELEPWNTDLVEKIGDLKNRISMQDEEVVRANENLKRTDLDAEGKKMWEDSRNFWTNQGDASRRELAESSRQLEKNNEQIRTFDTRNEESANKVENAKRELSDLMKEINTLKLEHKNAVKELRSAEAQKRNSRNEEQEVARLFSKIQEKQSLVSKAEQKIYGMEDDHQRSFS
jgi:chromosome segregation ATPase